jgi:hypothetical protein
MSRRAAKQKYIDVKQTHLEQEHTQSVDVRGEGSGAVVRLLGAGVPVELHGQHALERERLPVSSRGEEQEESDEGRRRTAEVPTEDEFLT